MTVVGTRLSRGSDRLGGGRGPSALLDGRVIRVGGTTLLVVPFLLLFDTSVLYVAVFLLDRTGIRPFPMRLTEEVLGLLGPVGRTVDIFFAAMLVLVGLSVAISVPLFVLSRDVRETLRRFGLVQPSDDRDPAE